MNDPKQLRARTRVSATIAVHGSDARPFDEAPTPALVEIHMSESFHGEIEGESMVWALQVRRDDRSASMVSMQRFRGALAGRKGSFVLQGSELVEDGMIDATWFVVPRSGTGDLAGLRGEGGFRGTFGKGSEGWLDYWFE